MILLARQVFFSKATAVLYSLAVDACLGRRRDPHHCGQQVVVGGDVHQGLAGRLHGLPRPPVVRGSGHRLGQANDLGLHFADVLGGQPPISPSRVGACAVSGDANMRASANVARRVEQRIRFSLDGMTNR